MLRLALIGCGGHSERAHASPLAHCAAQHPGEVALVAACDLDLARARRFCQQYGFGRAYSSLGELLGAEQLDAILSILPIAQAAEVGSLLLRSHLPCVLEKPPGRSLDEAGALAELARQTSTPHMVSMNRRFNPYLNRAIAWAGEIGPIHYIRGQMFRHARRDEDFLWGTGIHVVDAMRHVGGELETAAIHHPDHASLSAPWFLVTLRFASGASGHLEILPTAGMVEEGFELFGEGFRARVCTMGGGAESAHCWREGKLEVEFCAGPDEPLFLRDGSYEETSAFIRCLKAGEPLHPSLEEVLPTLAVCAPLAG